jgi:serine-type D-Ala-D-Ala carboxypeptidase/endopeptidase (penicillin-binding protein 4)
MKKVFLFIGCWLLVAVSSAQTVTQKLQKAFQQFENDSQLKHAISSLYVIDVKTGQVVFDKNAQVGLAPASTQKIITSVTAFELLGKDYRYKTELGYNGRIKDSILYGNINIIGSGDPTLGSWRWKSTDDNEVLKKWINEIKKLRISFVDGRINFSNPNFTHQSIPDGWIWQDIGNYYGTGTHSLNWKENQYELELRSENKIDGKVSILNNGWQTPQINELKAAGKGTGDNAYIYFDRSMKGTIPMGETKFVISGSSKDPYIELMHELISQTEGIIFFNIVKDDYTNEYTESLKGTHTIYTHYSPSLDSIIYWFNKKSINLYGEALIKTFAYEKQGFGSTDSGVAIVKKFWKDKGLDEDELNIYDGSGLSPLNRVTTHAQVEILKYAKTKDWFQYFYNSLPDYNGMRMKSGTISDVKGFCGYHKAKDGKEYIFSFLVNNYSGKTSGLVNKMYKVLDELK